MRHVANVANSDFHLTNVINVEENWMFSKHLTNRKSIDMIILNFRNGRPSTTIMQTTEIWY